MSLHVYTKRAYVPKHLKVEWLNGPYFDSTSLRDDEETRKILKTVDKAVYMSPYTYKRLDRQGELNLENLSTGCKTLLNILYNPDKCFDTIECGPNALAILPIITDGHALWEHPCAFKWEDMECDIDFHDETGIKHFRTFDSFLAYNMDGEEPEEQS